jgi:hypothetical protein
LDDLGHRVEEVPVIRVFIIRFPSYFFFLWLYSPFWTLAALHIGGFLNYLDVIGLLGRVISSSQGLYLHRTTQHRKTWTNIHAFRGIRTHDPSNQPAKIHASDRTATVTGFPSYTEPNYLGTIRKIFPHIRGLHPWTTNLPTEKGSHLTRVPHFPPVSRSHPPRELLNVLSCYFYKQKCQLGPKQL